MKMQLLPAHFTICKVADTSQIDFNQENIFFTKTAEEISLVCQTENVPLNTTEAESGWRALKICGILDFSLVGILATITGALADNGIGIFAISTYNTDYVLVQQSQIEKAVRVLSDKGYEIV